MRPRNLETKEFGVRRGPWAVGWGWVLNDDKKDEASFQTSDEIHGVMMDNSVPMAYQRSSVVELVGAVTVDT